jgi:hypothetical protein
MGINELLIHKLLIHNMLSLFQSGEIPCPRFRSFTPYSRGAICRYQLGTHSRNLLKAEFGRSHRRFVFLEHLFG